MAEAVTPDSSGIFGRRRLCRLLVDELLILELLVLELGSLGEPVAVHRLLGGLVRGDQLGEHPRERVDLVAAKLGPRSQAGRLFGEDALEAEHERESHLPLGGGLVAAGLDLGGRFVERVAPRRAGREHLSRLLAVVEEGLAGPVLGAFGCGDEIVSRRSW
jgi:hypothetical protein